MICTRPCMIERLEAHLQCAFCLLFLVFCLLPFCLFMHCFIDNRVSRRVFLVSSGVRPLLSRATKTSHDDDLMGKTNDQCVGHQFNDTMTLAFVYWKKAMCRHIFAFAELEIRKNFSAFFLTRYLRGYSLAQLVSGNSRLHPGDASQTTCFFILVVVLTLIHGEKNTRYDNWLRSTAKAA